MTQSTSASISLALRSHEFEQVLEVSSLFLRISLLVQGVGDPRSVQGVTTRLQQLRPFLERFDVLAVAQEVTPPTKVLDFVSQKGIYSLVMTVEAIRVCGVAALLFQDVYRMLPKSPPKQSSEPVQVDPAKLH